MPIRTLLLTLSLLIGNAWAAPPLIENGQRVLWLGDSVTANGTHIGLADAYLMTQAPDLKITNIACGLSSETACGLSEPLHPWPRPNVHERLDRAIEKLEFDVAIICYGINDAIYAPFDEGRFATYQKGMTVLIDKLAASGAKVIALTPAPFDPQSFPQAKLLPEGAEEYGYTKVYADYSKVMERYADWVLAQKADGKLDAVIEITRSLTAKVGERRKLEPDFKSGDGVHPNRETYAMLTEIVLTDLIGRDVNLNTVPEEKQKLALTRHKILSTAYREHVGHKRPGAPKNPMPLDEALAKAAELEKQIRR